MPYSIDSSGILDVFRYYPQDVFPTIWDHLELAAGSGVILAIDEVYHELEKKADDAFNWLEEHSQMIVPIDEEIQRRVTHILASYPRLVDTRKSRSAGDPFVIALAQVHKYSVVTGERPTGVITKPNIPDVCSALSIPCHNVLELFRREGWKA